MGIMIAPVHKTILNPQAFPTKTIISNGKSYKIDGSIIGHYILENYYNFSFIYHNPSHTSIEPMQGLIDNYNNFFNTHQDDWKRIIESRYIADYDSLSNYSVTEDIDRTEDNWASNTNTKKKGTTLKNETLRHEVVVTSNSGQDKYNYAIDKTTLTKSGSENNTGSDLTTVLSYDGIDRNLNKVEHNNTLSFTDKSGINRTDESKRDAREDTITKGVYTTVAINGMDSNGNITNIKPDETTITNSGKDIDEIEKDETAQTYAHNTKKGFIGISPVDNIRKEWNERIEKSITNSICKQFCVQTFFLYEGCEIIGIETI